MEKQEIMNTPDIWLSADDLAMKTLAILEENGYHPELKCYENHHIQVRSKRGKLYNYYPTTGRIMGEPDASGIDDLLELLARW